MHATQPQARWWLIRCLGGIWVIGLVLYLVGQTNIRLHQYPDNSETSQFRQSLRAELNGVLESTDKTFFEDQKETVSKQYTLWQERLTELTQRTVALEMELERQTTGTEQWPDDTKSTKANRNR